MKKPAHIEIVVVEDGILVRKWSARLGKRISRKLTYEQIIKASSLKLKKKRQKSSKTVH